MEVQRPISGLQQQGGWEEPWDLCPIQSQAGQPQDDLQDDSQLSALHFRLGVVRDNFTS